MIHAQLDDRNVRPLAQVDEREREADVVVEVAPIANHPIPRRQRYQLIGMAGKELRSAHHKPT